MKEYFKKLPRELKKIVKQSAQVSRQTRMPAYLVGGCLRDLILGVDNFDLDITVEGDGIIFAQALAKKLSTHKYTAKSLRQGQEKLMKLVVHERFRSATLILPGHLKVDIATTRQERYPACAVLPVVSPGSLKEDLRRRDFTINAMAVSLTVNKEQKIIDPFGGQEDLSSGIIRILHNLSFKDDPTRILRAIRFSQRFDFKIEPKTLVLLKEAIRDGLLEKVNLHRIRDELILIFKERDSFRPIKKLADLGALSFISSKLKIGEPTRGFFSSLTKEIAWFVKNFPARRQPDIWLVYLAAFLEPLPLAEIKMIIHGLGLSKGEAKRVVSYYQRREKIIYVLSKKQVKPEKIFSLLEPLSYEAIILLSATSQNKYFKKHLINFLKIYNGMRLCVSGDDLCRLGVLPGPEYRKIFARLLVAKLNGKLKNRQSELDLINKLTKQHNKNGAKNDVQA
jgi:tRNA nucleotidyltransferase (CCA-adding enzyme)